MGVEEEILKEAERTLGRENLRKVISRILEDLASVNPKLEGISVPEDPKDIDLSKLGPEERRNFLFLLLDLCDCLGCERLKGKFLKKL